MDIVVEFLVMFIAAGVGFIIGVVFMGVATAGAMALLDNQIYRLKKELSLATGDLSQDEHPEMGRSPPTGPMGDVPGTGGGPLGNASVGRKG